MIEQVRLGKTNLMVSRVSMGCIPIQRRTMQDAVELLRHAYDSGVNFYDTAHVYSDSEEKIGAAFSGGLRDKVIIATKAMSTTYQQTTEQLETSLRRLKTDYIDLYQWHNPSSLEDFQRADGPYQAMLDAQKAGKIRHIGITNHHLGRAYQAIESGAFATMQYPLSPLSTREELEMAAVCRDNDMGVIAMKGMCGGLLTDGRLPFAFLSQFPHIVPIWGVERKEELDQFLELSQNPQPFTPAMQAEVDALKAEFGDEFCRGCGYCLPCPVGIPINMANRMTQLIQRSPSAPYFTDEWRALMDKIEDCTRCGACEKKCPYDLKPYETLPEHLAYYRALVKGRRAEHA